MKAILAAAALLISINCFAFNDEQRNTSSQCITPTITAGAYTAGDAVGGQMDFDLALGLERKSGLVRSARVVDASGAKSPLWVFCFDQDFTEASDNAAIAYSIADISHAILIVSVTTPDYTELGVNGTVAQIEDIDKRVKGTDTYLRCQMQTISAPVYNDVNELTVCLDILKDSQ